MSNKKVMIIFLAAGLIKTHRYAKWVTFLVIQQSLLK